MLYRTLCKCVESTAEVMGNTAAAAVLLWVRQAFFPSGAASVLLAVLAAVQAAGLIPLGLALRDRLKEIKGGELYEARQY